MSHCTIALSGLSDIDAGMFQAVLDGLADDAWKVVNAAPATLLVVDIDTVWGHMDWLRATAEGQIVAAYTQQTEVRGCDLVLHKRLQAREFSDVLARVIDADTMAAPAGAPHADHASPAPEPVLDETLAAVELDADSRPPAQPEPLAEPGPAMSLGECLLAGKITRPLTIKDDEGTRLTLDPARGGYTGPNTLAPLRPLLRMPLAEAVTLDPATIEQMWLLPALPLTRLLWFAAMVVNEGQLAPGLDPAGHYRLTRWPQIEREFPRHFRIATAMMQGPRTVDEIAAASSAPAGDVADFINAYYLAGYVSAGAATADPARASSGGMFARLKRPFSRGGKSSA